MADYWSIIKTFGGGSKRTKITLYPAADTPTTKLPIPPDALLNVTLGEEKFDKSPVKIPETSERTLEWNLRKLDEFDTDLRDKIFSPVAAPSFFYPWSITPANVWIISDDGGNAALAEADFIVRFIGVQKDVPEASGKANLSTSKFEIQLVSIYRYIIEGLEPYYLSRRMTGADTSFVPSITSEVETYLWDSAYQDSNSEWIAVVYNSVDSDIYGNVDSAGEGLYTQKRYTMFQIYDLMEEIRLTIEYVWSVLVPGSVEVNWAGAIPPFGNLRFYKQNYAADDDVGDPVFAEASEVWMVGLIESRKYDAANNAPLTAWTPTGGAFHHDGGKGWIASYTNCWDLLGDIASNFGAKIILEFDGVDGNMYWMPYRDSRAAAVTITAADFYDGDITWKKGEYRIRGCTAQITGEAGIRSVSEFNPGASENRDSGTIKALFNNVPVSHKSEMIPFYNGNLASGVTLTYQINANAVREHVLFYKETSPAWWTDGAVFMRVHHHVDIDDGVTNYNTPTLIPRTDFDATIDWTTARHLLWDDIVAYGQQATLRSGLPYRMCYVNTQMLSGETMVYEGKGLNTKFPLEKIGDTYSFDATIITNAFSGLIAPTCFLIAVKEDSDQLNSFTLLAIGT